MHRMRKPKAGCYFIVPERFLTIGEGTQRGSYHERKLNEARAYLEALAPDCDTVYPGLIVTREDAGSAIDLFTREKVDFVLAIYLSWAEDFAFARLMRDMPPCPILFCHRIRDFIDLNDTHDDDEFAEYLCCGGLVGSLEASGDLKRYGRKQTAVFAGTLADILARVRTFANAARARALLKDSRIGLLACMNEVMWSTYVDPYAVFQKIGPELQFYSVAELEDITLSIPESEARGVMESIAGRYEVLPNVDEGKFLASVRASMAMERLAEKHGLDLVVLNDIDTVLFAHIGLRPGFWPTSPDVKTLIVPEGDIGGGIACYALKLLSGDRHVNYLEPFHIDLPGNNFAGGHAGPNDYTDPRGKCKISSDVRFAKTKWKYAGAPFAWYVFPEGRKTMLHCSMQTGNFQFVSAQIEALPTEHFLATYCHSLFRAADQDNTALFTKLMEHGVTQHYGIADGDMTDALRDLAMMLDIEYAAL